MICLMGPMAFEGLSEELPSVSHCWGLMNPTSWIVQITFFFVYVNSLLGSLCPPFCDLHVPMFLQVLPPPPSLGITNHSLLDSSSLLLLTIFLVLQTSVLSWSSAPSGKLFIILETTCTRHPQTNQSMSFGNSCFSFGSQMKSDCLEIFLQPRIRSGFLSLCFYHPMCSQHLIICLG